MRRRWARRAGVAGLLALALGLGAFISAPLPAGLLSYGELVSTRIVDRRGALLRELRSASDGRGSPVFISELPAHVQAAFLAAEDKGFHSHLGVSVTAVVRAALQNVKSGSVVAGGSTITQQLARALVPRPRTLLGKAQEALWAFRLEAHLSKARILEQYLNRAPFGNNAVGLEAAAGLYFGKRAKHLTLGEAAMLAAIPRGPTAYNPYRHADRLEARRRWVLKRLEENRAVAGELLAVAFAQRPVLGGWERSFHAPHFVEYVAANLGRWGLKGAAEVRTSLDLELQLRIEEQVAQEVSRLAERHVGNAAVLVVDNASGEVLAYHGSADFFDTASGGQNDGVQMHRQPGSALKPFVYAEAFRRGYTPATVIADLETAFAGAKGSYAPKNYDRRLHGPVRAREALASSYNVPAVRVAEDVGLPMTLDVLRRAGFESLSQGAEHYGLGLALGNGEVSLWESARAYRGLARGGVVSALKPVLSAVTPEGGVLAPSAELKTRRFADARAVALVTSVISDNSARARAFGLSNVLRLPFATAVKTGTSKGYSDNWTVGFTAERTVAVWAGNFDGTPMVQVSGITGAGPIFKRAMQTAMANVQPGRLFDERGLEMKRICPLSGQLAASHCPASVDEHFIEGTAPAHACAMHGAMGAEVPQALSSRCAALAKAEGRLTDLGLDFYDWARNEGLAREPWLAALCMGQSSGKDVEILHPGKGDEFLLVDDLPPADQAIPLRVRAAPALGSLEVLVDGAVVSMLPPPYTGRLAAARGPHQLELRVPGGPVLAAVRYMVRSESR